MAQGHTSSKTVIVNNVPTTTVTKTVELIVIDNQLAPKPQDINPGVNTKDFSW